MTGPSGDRPRPRPRPAPAAHPVEAKAPADAKPPVDAKAPVDAEVSPLATPTRSRSGRGSWLIVGAGILLVALVVLDVLLVLRYRHNDDARAAADRRNARSVATTYRAALAAATTRTPQILSYGYRTIDADIARATGDLTGKFRTDYTQLLTTTVKPAAVSGRITTTAKAVGSSVVDATGTTVSVLVFIDQTTTSGAKQTPQLNGTRVQVVLTEVGHDWLIANLTPV